jgi:hypothetical protein
MHRNLKYEIAKWSDGYGKCKADGTFALDDSGNDEILIFISEFSSY